MKAEELMIGDWIFCKYLQHNTRVIALPKPDNYLHIVVEEEGFELVFTEKYFEPIPLTPEILKKNGFEKDQETGECLLSDYDDTFEVYWIGTILTVQSGYGRMELVNCQYVHELQHALRLCGINKDIIV